MSANRSKIRINKTLIVCLASTKCARAKQFDKRGQTAEFRCDEDTKRGPTRTMAIREKQKPRKQRLHGLEGKSRRTTSKKRIESSHIRANRKNGQKREHDVILEKYIYESLKKMGQRQQKATPLILIHPRSYPTGRELNDSKARASQGANRTKFGPVRHRQIRLFRRQEGKKTENKRGKSKIPLDEAKPFQIQLLMQ